ncbi:MAG: GNAT family N-acetyltransferase [Chloroflexi bacterium]|nr:GNAT family N-acetyltransferase [Chloroflexota bacterium]
MNHPNVENWWAVQAMIASYNHVYQVVYGTGYESRGIIGVSIYRDAPIAPYQLEFLALTSNPKEIVEAIHAYPIDGQKYVLDIFHDKPSSKTLKTDYLLEGYEFVRTGVILGLDLPIQIRSNLSGIHKAVKIHEAEEINLALSVENEHMPTKCLRGKHIHNFYAKADGQIAGWAQLVTIYPGVGYLNQVYVMSAFRQRGIGRALVERAHQHCNRQNLEHMVVIPSEIALHLYRRIGYRPLAYFTAFHPRETGTETSPEKANGTIPETTTESTEEME